MPPNEDILLRQAQQGDAHALGQLLEQHQHRLFNVCLRMVRHRDDAAELTQESLLKILQHLGDFRGDSSLSTWMIRIAMNLCLSHLRKRTLRLTASLEEEHTPGRDDQASSLRDRLAENTDREPSPLSNVQHREEQQRLQVALSKLEDAHRAVLVLRDIEGMDYEQIAHTLSLAVGTVKSRLFRARLSLREIMLKPQTTPVIHQTTAPHPAKPNLKMAEPPPASDRDSLSVSPQPRDTSSLP